MTLKLIYLDYDFLLKKQYLKVNIKTLYKYFFIELENFHV